MKYVIIFSLLFVTQIFAAEFKKEGEIIVTLFGLTKPLWTLKNSTAKRSIGTLELTGEDRTTVNVVAYIEIRPKNSKRTKILEGFQPVVKRDGSKISCFGNIPNPNRLE